MACQRFSALPSSAAVLTGTEIVPMTDGANVDRKTLTGSIAISATFFDAALTYTAGHQVIDSFGNIYFARQTTLGDVPFASPADWKLAYVLNPIQLNVPDQYPTIIAAMAALEDAVIAAAVTIQVEDGAYNYTTTQINLAHPYGRYITIIGNTGSPGSCSLSFSALPSPPTNPFLTDTAGSIYANGPSGVTINGISVLKSGGAPVFGHNGIFTANGAEINVGANMIVSGFYGDLGVFNGGVLNVASGVSLTTVTGSYGIYADNGTVDAPGVSIAGAGDAIATVRNAYVRVDDAAINAAIGTFVTMTGGTVEASGAVIGNVDIFYEVGGPGNTVIDTGATYGTAATYEIGLTGSLDYNGAIATGDSVTFLRGLLTDKTVQLITGSTASVFLDATNGGIDTVDSPLFLSADGVTGATISTAGAFSATNSLKVGATAVTTGLQGGAGVLDAAGVLTVVAAWVTANTIIVPVFNDATATGPRLQSAITPTTSFTLTSGAGAADVGKAVRWHAIVYP